MIENDKTQKRLSHKSILTKFRQIKFWDLIITNQKGQFSDGKLPFLVRFYNKIKAP